MIHHAHLIVSILYALFSFKVRSDFQTFLQICYSTKTDVMLSDPAIKLSLKNVILSCGLRNAIM